MEKYTLRKPINFEGNEITEIEYDLEALTGADLIQAERTSGVSSGEVKFIPYASPEYQAVVLSLAASRPMELIKALKAADFAFLTSVVGGFLMSAG